MTHHTIEAGDLSSRDVLLEVVCALAHLGQDEELEVRTSFDSGLLRAFAEEERCDCSDLHPAGGGHALLIRRREG